jgi:hypothetical protein
VGAQGIRWDKGEMLSEVDYVSFYGKGKPKPPVGKRILGTPQTNFSF